MSNQAAKKPKRLTSRQLWEQILLELQANNKLLKRVVNERERRERRAAAREERFAMREKRLTAKEKRLQSLPWCPSCQSFHPVPRDAAHKTWLACTAP